MPRRPLPFASRIFLAFTAAMLAVASGLGLPLCREIVEAHGGLRIERRDGGGTAVVCWLPGE